MINKETKLSDVVGDGSDHENFERSQNWNAFFSWIAYGLIWGVPIWLLLWFVLSMFSEGGILTPISIIGAKFAVSTGAGHELTKYLVDGKTVSVIKALAASDPKHYLIWFWFRGAVSLIPGAIAFWYAFLYYAKASIKTGLKNNEDEHIDGTKEVDPVEFQNQLDIDDYNQRQSKYYIEPKMLIKFRVVHKEYEEDPKTLFERLVNMIVKIEK
jgi:hypothetical protein